MGRSKHLTKEQQPYHHNQALFELHIFSSFLLFKKALLLKIRCFETVSESLKNNKKEKEEGMGNKLIY